MFFRQRLGKNFRLYAGKNGLNLGVKIGRALITTGGFIGCNLGDGLFVGGNVKELDKKHGKGFSSFMALVEQTAIMENALKEHENAELRKLYEKNVARIEKDMVKYGYKPEDFQNGSN